MEWRVLKANADTEREHLNKILAEVKVETDDLQTQISGITTSLTSSNSKLTAPVSLTTGGTWYDGPSLSLAAGTWLVSGTATVGRTDATANDFFARISDGTTHYASGGIYHPAVANVTQTISLSTVLTLASTTTIKVQATALNNGSANTLFDAVRGSIGIGTGDNATQITAVKLT